MSEKLCTLRKIGGGTELKETVLWTNPSPTSSFSNRNRINLNQSVVGFNYIGVYFRASTTQADETLVLCPINMYMTNYSEPTDYKKTPNKFYPIWCGIAGNSATSPCYQRGAAGSSDTTIKFTVAQATEMANPPENNSYLIPIKVVGLK